MKVSIIPASTQAGKETIAALLKQPDPPRIRAIYRNTSKAPSQFTDNAAFEAVQGGIDNGLDLDFDDSDAVFYIPPPTYDDAIDSGDHAIRGAERVKVALRKASKAQRLVVLSALGAQHSKGIGILKINHVTDKILADSAPEVVVVRPGWFQENWADALKTAQGDPSYFETYFTPVDHPITMISLRDVGETVAKQIVSTGKQLPSTPHTIVLHGPRNYSMLDLQNALEEVAGKKPRVDAVQAEELWEFYKRVLPPGKAEEVAEMTLAINGGGLLAGEMAEPGKDVVRGRTELMDTLLRLASGEVSKVASGAF